MENVSFNCDIMDSYIQHQNYTKAADYLKSVILYLKKSKRILDEYTLNYLCQLTLTTMKTNSNNSVILSELFRILRNASIEPKMHNVISNNIQLIYCSINLSQSSALDEKCVKIIYQFFINVVVGDSKCANLFQINFFLKCFDNTTLVYYKTALFYNVLLKMHSILHPNICLIIFRWYQMFACQAEGEFLHFSIDFIVKCFDFWNFYFTFEYTSKRLILETIVSRFPMHTTYFEIHENGIIQLAKEFCDLTANYTSNTEHILLVSQILAQISSNENSLCYLQVHKNVFEAAAILLKRLNIFESNTPSDLEQMLVKFIGNGCWKNKTIQNVIYQQKCVPIFMKYAIKLNDTTPFIREWAVIAIRNLFDNDNCSERVHTTSE